jgi:type IV secretion system protein TrbI
MKKTNSIQSPDVLELKPKPRISARVGKLAGFAVLALLGLAGAIIAFNIATHKGTGLGKGAQDKNKNLAAALSIPEELFSRVPGKGVSPLNAADPPALDIKRREQEPEAPAPSPSPQLPNSEQPPINQSPQAPQTDLAQQEREAALQKALAAGTGLDGFQSNLVANAGNSQQPSNDGNLAALLQLAKQNGLGSSKPPNQALSGMREEPDQNRQEQKLSFLEKASKQLETPYLPATRKAPLSPLEIKTGTIIPATMVDGINSDLPGDLIAQVSENVYDTATGQHLLIPQGTKSFGTYDSQVAYAQSRLLIVWKRLIFPDGSTLELAGMPGANAGGYAGFQDKVDNHYFRLISGAVLTSLLSAGFQLSQPTSSTSTTNGSLNAMEVGAAAVGQQVSQLGLELSRRNLSIQPTIIVRPGYQFVIKVNRDVVFPSVYSTPRFSPPMGSSAGHRRKPVGDSLQTARFSKETPDG